jgi:hypothetical protein
MSLSSPQRRGKDLDQEFEGLPAKVEEEIKKGEM